jgi:hypothetical protein
MHWRLFVNGTIRDYVPSGGVFRILKRALFLIYKELLLSHLNSPAKNTILSTGKTRSSPASPGHAVGSCSSRGKPANDRCFSSFGEKYLKKALDIQGRLLYNRSREERCQVGKKQDAVFTAISGPNGRLREDQAAMNGCAFTVAAKQPASIVPFLAMLRYTAMADYDGLRRRRSSLLYSYKTI